MKTKINHLLGAVLPLLVTFGSKHSPAALTRLLIIGLAALAAVPGETAAPNSGGGTGGGTIYYVGPFPGWTTGGTAVMTMMNSDGSAKTVLGAFGNPSTALYNNHRWFIYTQVIT